MKHPKMSNKLIYFAFFSFFLFTDCSNTKTTARVENEIKKNTINCISLINDGKKYWKNDSLGKNGYRILLVTEVLNNCRFENLKFEEIRTGLGNPTETIENEGGIREFIYRVSYNSHLVIKVQDDTIIKFRVSTTDG